MPKSKKNKKKQQQNARTAKVLRDLNQIKQEVAAKNRRGLIPENFNIKIGKGKLHSTNFGDLNMEGVELGYGNKKARSARSMVGLAERAVNPQVMMPRITSTVRNGVQYDTLVGSDFLGEVTSSGSGQVAGDILFSQVIAPSRFAESRLGQFSSLYQRYRFRDVRFIYDPIANATQSGQIIGYADFDVDNPQLVDNPSNVKIAAAHQGERVSQIWDAKVFDMQQAGTFTDLFTQAGQSAFADPRFELQGNFYLLAASTIAPSIPLGNMYVQYIVEFSIPALANTSLAGGGSWTAQWFWASVGVSSAQLEIGSGSVLQYSFGSVGAMFSGNTISFPVEAGSTTWITMAGESTSAITAAGSDGVAIISTGSTATGTFTTQLGVCQNPATTNQSVSLASSFLCSTGGELVMAFSASNFGAMVDYQINLAITIVPAPTGTNSIVTKRDLVDLKDMLHQYRKTINHSLSNNVPDTDQSRRVHNLNQKAVSRDLVKHICAKNREIHHARRGQICRQDVNGCCECDDTLVSRLEADLMAHKHADEDDCVIPMDALQTSTPVVTDVIDCVEPKGGPVAPPPHGFPNPFEGMTQAVKDGWIALQQRSGDHIWLTCSTCASPYNASRYDRCPYNTCVDHWHVDLSSYTKATSAMPRVGVVPNPKPDGC